MLHIYPYYRYRFVHILQRENSMQINSSASVNQTKIRMTLRNHTVVLISYTINTIIIIHVHAYTGPWHRECVDIVERSDLDHMWAARSHYMREACDWSRLLTKERKFLPVALVGDANYCGAIGGGRRALVDGNTLAR